MHKNLRQDLKLLSCSFTSLGDFILGVPMTGS